MTENEIGTLVVKYAIAVHKGLGPGLLESVYEFVFAEELRHQGFDGVSPKTFPRPACAATGLQHVVFVWSRARWARCSRTFRFRQHAVDG